MRYIQRSAFTLVELLIVIAILSTLASAVVVVLNPGELLSQSRDSTRVSELQSLNKDLTFYLQNQEALPALSTNTVYVSVPDSTLPNGGGTCSASLNLPSLPSTFTYKCRNNAEYRLSNGNGWLPVNFSLVSTVSLPALPIDPINQNFNYYAFIYGSSNQWALMTLLDSQKYLKSTSSNDGGTDPGRFETGNNLNLIAQAEGLVGYWPMDEGSGTTTQDASGNGNNGTLTNGPTWTAESSCKVGKCLSFDGINDYVSILDNSSNQYTSGGLTILGWVNTNDNAGFIFSKPWNGTGQYNYNLALNLSAIIYGNPSPYGTTGSVVSLNNFHQVVLSLNDSTKTISIYTDGFLNSSSNHSISNYSPSLGNSNLPLALMTLYPYGSGWVGVADHAVSGYLDGVRLYSRALFASEIKAIYIAQK